MPVNTRPLPTSHLVHHAVHASLPAVALNVPLVHARHVRSALAVCALSMYMPAEHGALTPWQVLPSLAFEKVEPVHVAHWRSAMAEPSAVIPDPAGQVRHSAHTPLPAVALKEPVAQGAHVRSLLTVDAASMYSPAVQGALTTWQPLPSFAFE